MIHNEKHSGLRAWVQLILVVFSAYPSMGKADEVTLRYAHDLAKEYKHYTYGTGPNKIDCVHFVLNVIERQLGEPISVEARKATLIAYGWSAEETQQKAKDGTDPRLGGVQYALTTIVGKGKTIKPSDAKPGHLIQYWMPTHDGKWFGHAAVITKVQGMKATILGTHESLNSVAELDTPLNLAGTNRHLFIVRIGN